MKEKCSQVLFSRVVVRRRPLKRTFFNRLAVLRFSLKFVFGLLFLRFRALYTYDNNMIYSRRGKRNKVIEMNYEQIQKKWKMKKWKYKISKIGGDISCGQY